jgi:hypothetical protein
MIRQRKTARMATTDKPECRTHQELARVKPPIGAVSLPVDGIPSEFRSRTSTTPRQDSHGF